MPFIAKRNEVAIKRKLGGEKEKNKKNLWCGVQRERGEVDNKQEAMSHNACCWNLLSLLSSAQICENASYNFLSSFRLEENLLEEPQAEEEEEEETAQEAQEQQQEQQGSLRFYDKSFDVMGRLQGDSCLHYTGVIWFRV